MKFKINDIVTHIKDSNVQGIIVDIDENLKDTTTCLVLWEDCSNPDVQWTNKLIHLKGE